MKEFFSQSLEREIDRGRPRMRFEPALERQFRMAARTQRRRARILLFAIPGVIFAMAPLYSGRIFDIPEAELWLMRRLEHGLILPMCLAGILSVCLPMPRTLAQGIQSAAVISLWIGLLLFRFISIGTSFVFPAQMLGIGIIAVSILGGFGWRRVFVGSTLAAAAAISLEVLRPGPSPMIDSLSLVLLVSIGVVGAYINEQMHRRIWLQAQMFEQLARVDGLTGLANRAGFNQQIGVTLAQAQRENKGVGLILLDLDQFKSINDRYGHLFGDEVLRQVGATLQAAARRPLDIRARYGGEEMILVWYDLAAQHLQARIEDVLSRIRGLNLPLPAGGTLPLTASAGALWLMPKGLLRPEELLARADALLYRAKAEGRNRACLEMLQG